MQARPACTDAEKQAKASESIVLLELRFYSSVANGHAGKAGDRCLFD
ncbi:MAG: hypothetical protein ACU88J_06690 [Gammaproteobacteria bacterium]